MEIGTVSTLSMAGIVVSLLISIGLPIGLCIFLWKKKGARLNSFLVGCATFIVAAMVLEQLLHAVVISVAGEVISGNIWLYAMYGGLAAALFEETGRYVAMKRFIKGPLDRENALMYGVGHGGAEAILLIGMIYINNLMTAVMINSGGVEQSLAEMGITVEQQEATIESISALWTTPSYQFFLSGAERVMAIALQIAFSVLVYKAVKSGEKKFLAAAYASHFLVDAISVVVTNFLPIWVVEIVILAMTVVVVVLAAHIYRNEPQEEPQSYV